MTPRKKKEAEHLVQQQRVLPSHPKPALFGEPTRCLYGPVST